MALLVTNARYKNIKKIKRKLINGNIKHTFLIFKNYAYKSNNINSIDLQTKVKT